MFYQKVSNLKFLRNKLLSWSKNGIQKNGILKNFAPFKLLAYFKRFENLAPISKCFVKRYFKPFVCVFENFEKSDLLQMAFSKNGFMKTWFQNLLKMLYLQKVLVYQI
jgi:hypothetical protein